MHNHIAKHFVLQLGALTSLYVFVVAVLLLTFGLINLWLPVAADSYWQLEQASESVRIGFALTVIFFPAYLLLTRIVQRNRRDQSETAYLELTKWLVYTSLLVGGMVLLINLVTVVYFFLEGDITIRFILKAGAVMFVAGAAFAYYLYDVQGYWVRHAQRSAMYGYVTIALVVSILICALLFIETPAEVRAARLDVNQVSDLQNMHLQIQSYYVRTGTLPDTLGEAYDGFSVPEAETKTNRTPYRYAQKGSETYELCATFAFDSEDEHPTLGRNNDWRYQAGEWCFDRVAG